MDNSSTGMASKPTLFLQPASAKAASEYEIGYSPILQWRYKWHLHSFTQPTLEAAIQ